MRKLPAIISIHDVMPSTLANVEFLIEQKLEHVDPKCVLLLVVPGLDWSPKQIQKLKQWEQKGYELAGHGWVHSVSGIKTIYHKFHSFFISRRAAEHLSLSENELIELLQKNSQWFKDHDFKTPKFYVPPAWALGRISREALSEFSFCGIETTSGIELIKEKRRKRLPLVGFEADTHFRAAFLKFWNQINAWFAKTLRPVRVSIHPYDHELLIANQLFSYLNRAEPQHWSDVFQSNKKERSFDESHNNA